MSCRDFSQLNFKIHIQILSLPDRSVHVTVVDVTDYSNDG